MMDSFHPRHCDPGVRPGEAIQPGLGGPLDCFVASLLAMTITD